MKSLFRRNIALPQDHGAWVFILSPLLIGIFTAEAFNAGSLALTVAAMAAFLIRQPVTIAIKAYSGRRPRTDLPAARFWMVIYGVIILLSIGELMHLGETYILLLAIPALPVFAWHLYLVSKRDERKQAGIEILATGVLALAAPAAYWVGNDSYSPIGWLLWLLTWLQSAASIVHAYMRLEQRELKEQPDPKTRWKIGQRALAYTTFNFFLVLVLSFFNLVTIWLTVPFFVQWMETLWCIYHPAIGEKPVKIGTRQLIVSTIFTVLFIITWRLT